MSPQAEAEPRWKRILRYMAYAVGVFLLVAVAYSLLWYWPQKARQDLSVKPGSQDIELLEKSSAA